MLNFVIPTSRDDLLTCTSGQYYVEEVYSTRLIPVKIQEAKSCLLKEGGSEIGKHFEAFFSVTSKFNELDVTIKQLAWTILTKGCEKYCNSLHKALDDRNNDTDAIWESDERKNYLSALKMNVYLLVQMTELYQSASRQNAMSTTMASHVKGKKGIKAKAAAVNLGINWESECQKSIQLLMNFVDLDIHRLWETQLVEDEFTSLISNLLYKILEDQTMVKCKPVKSSIFHLLGCIIKKHSQSLSSSLKLVQMLQHFEHIAQPMAEAVHLWTNTYKCKSLVAEILRELSHIEEKEFVRDSASTKTICCFVLELSKVLPAEVLSHISFLHSRMEEESYQMRNTVLGVFGEILIQCLNGEGLEEKAKSDRDQFLDILYDHANLDVSAFVRCRSLHIILDLVKEQVLPVKRCPNLVDLCVRLLLDKSNLVRKATVQLLEGLLRWNPFAATLPITVLQEGLDEAKLKLEEMQKSSVSSELESSSENNQSNLDDANQQEDTEPQEKPADQRDDNAEEDTEEQTTQSDDSETLKQQKIIMFLSDSVCFVEKFHEAVPVLCQLLRSRTQSDVLEAISFFTAAWEFKLGFAIRGIAEMLEQIWNEEKKIRDAVVYAYRELYFKQSGASCSKTHSEQVADNMVMLAAGSTKEKLEAVEALIVEMEKSGDIPAGVTTVLWDRFVNPPSSFTMERGISEAKQQRVMVQLLGMLANSNPSMLRSKIDVLADVGLKDIVTTADTSDTSTDKRVNFELAYHTCTTLLKLAPRKLEAGKFAQQFRMPDDHKVFASLTHLLVAGFHKTSNTWIRFALQAAGVIFQLAEHPIPISTLIFNKLQQILSDHARNENPSGAMVDKLLTRFFSISGHFALKLLIFIDGDVQSELKRRRKLEEEKEEADKKAKKKTTRRSRNSDKDKTDNNLEDEMGVGGATADDGDQEMIKNILETEIVGPDSLLGSIAEMLVRSCLLNVSKDNVTSVRVQQSAALALAKYMMVSAEFCEKHMRLFFTMLDTSSHEGIRANLTICAGDLCVRFPNILEPWTANIYARLNDSSYVVRIYAIKVLTNLILNDMIKVKGHVSEMAKCIADENERISMLAKQFFQELSKKGNAVYNVMPDIISRLSDPELGIKDEVDFKSIMRFLFEYIQKDKQSESLVEKLCHRFKATRIVRQWRDLAFCLSMLNYTEKGVKKIIENFSFYADVLRDEQVYYCFDIILNKCKKSAKPELMVQIDELEGKIIDHHAQGVSEDESTAKAANASKKYKLPRSQSVNQQPETPSPRKRRRFSLVRDLTISCDKIDVSSKAPSTSSLCTDDYASVFKRPSQSPPNHIEKRRRFPTGTKRGVSSVSVTKTRKKRRESFCSDDDIGNTDVTSVAGRRTMRKRSGRQKTAMKFSSDDDSDNDDAKENLRTTSTSEDEEDPLSQTSDEVATPIRRKKTPKRAPARSVLRV